MLPTLSWLDFSSWDRERALDIMAQLREKDTRDELGIGTVRDAFADRLFPGTSTLQTRARYFLFVPWTYRKLESRHTHSAAFADKARKEELALCRALLESGEVQGVIGRVADRELQRLPSSIYWRGLGSWGLRVHARGQTEHHRALDRWYRSLAASARILKGDEAEQRFDSNWDPMLPEPPTDFPDGVDFSLTGEEAQYLFDKISSRHPDTLLQRMLLQSHTVSDERYPWEWTGLKAVPAQVRQLVGHASCFARVMAGAVALYNLMLADLRTDRFDVDAYRQNMDEWALDLSGSGADLGAWDLRAFQALLDDFGVTKGKLTRTFIEQWIQIVLTRDPASLADDKEVRALIGRRELHLKGGLARLRGGRALELWGGSSGLGMLNYRWHKVRQIVADIRHGMDNGAG